MKIYSLLIGIFCISFANAQISTNSSGGNITSSVGTISYSIGQIVQQTKVGSSGSEAPGVQHAIEIFNVGIKNQALKVSIKIYPNPTNKYLILQVEETTNQKISYQLFDMYGKLIITSKISNLLTNIDISNLPTATYLLQINDMDSKKNQLYKIIKN